MFAMHYNPLSLALLVVNMPTLTQQIIAGLIGVAGVALSRFLGFERPYLVALYWTTAIILLYRFAKWDKPWNHH